MASLSLKMKAGIGGEEWRCYLITHAGAATTTITAGSLDLSYIKAIIGEHACVAVAAKPGSILCGMTLSISANNDSLIWVSTVACNQYVTIVGW